jgi:hypothetical protein
MPHNESHKYCRTGVGRGLARHFQVQQDLPANLKELLLRLRLADDRVARSITPERSTDRPVLTNRMARQELNLYLKRIGAYLPDWFCRTVIWLRKPERHIARFVVSLLLILGGFLSFLPVLGLWMLPLGLIIVSQDLPFLQAPLVRMLRWTERTLQKLRKRFPSLNGGQSKRSA